MNFVAGLCGVIVMVLIIMRMLKTDFDTANKEFDYKKFFKRELPNIFISIMAVVLTAVLLPDILNYRPGLALYVRTMFTASGMLGSFFLTYVFGRSKKYIRNIVDIKTNIADGKVKAECKEEEEKTTE